jgi:hypothetical protein
MKKLLLLLLLFGFVTPMFGGMFHRVGPTTAYAADDYDQGEDFDD